MLPALALKGSRLTVERVAVRSGRRYFLDLLRQIGGEFELQDLGEETYDLHVHPSELKSTRVAAQRADNVHLQVPLLYGRTGYGCAGRDRYSRRAGTARGRF